MTGLIAVLIIRLLVPFTIPKWPFWGAIAALVADAIDLRILNLDISGWKHGNGIEYHSIDKFLDTYYLAFEWFVVLKFTNPTIKKTLSGLFLLRAAGVVLFEFTRIRYILFFTPNIFEYAYLVVMWVKKFMPRRQVSLTKVMVWAIIILIPLKLTQEYIMHVREYPLGIGTIYKLLMQLIL